MSKQLSVRLDKSRLEKLAFLYKLYRIKNETDTDCFREMLDKLYSEKTENQEQSESSRHEDQVQILEGWDCTFRFPVDRYHKQTREWLRKVLCFNPKTREIVKTNELDAEVCKRCYDTGGSANMPVLSEPKKTQKPRPTSKPQTVKKERKCVDCGCDISNLEDWKTLCLLCWKRKQNPAWQGEGKPLAGSPMALRMKEAEAIRRANERMNEKPKEE